MQLPTAGLDAAWSDALGETDPMRKGPAEPEDIASGEQLAQLVRQRVKRIAERAYWDTVQVRGTPASCGWLHAGFWSCC